MRYVIKIGTSSLFNEDGSVKELVLKNILECVIKLFNEGHEIAIVVSGAVVCGKFILKQLIEKLEKEENKENNNFYIEYIKIQNKIEFEKNLNKKINQIEKSILAGIGQTEMMRIIQSKAFSFGILTEQVLLCGKKDLKRSIAIKNIKKCFKNKILAVVNANDTVYKKDLVNEGNQIFSDNDYLASDLAKTLKADRLFLITNVEGYLDFNNKVINEITVKQGKHYLKRTPSTKSTLGCGGMYSKLKNALSFAKSGGVAFITSAQNIPFIIEISNFKKIAGTKIYNNFVFINNFKKILNFNFINKFLKIY